MAFFQRSPGNKDNSGLEGVVTFFNSYHALRAESVLKKDHQRVRLIPGPREISPNCGVALRFDYSALNVVTRVLSEARVQIEKVHFYPEQ